MTDQTMMMPTPQSFIEREMHNLNAALCGGGPDQPRYAEIYAAQQALAWALDPSCAASPTKFLFGEDAGSLNFQHAGLTT